MERKLYKSSRDRVLAGVCGGIGEYFAVDSVIIRLLWVVFVLMGGAGLVAYIIAAIIIPEKPIGNMTGDEYTRYEENDYEQTNRGRNSGVIIGIILIIFGASVLIKEFVPWIPKDFFLAAILIGLGIFFLVRRR